MKDMTSTGKCIFSREASKVQLTRGNQINTLDIFISLLQYVEAYQAVIVNTTVFTSFTILKC